MTIATSSDAGNAIEPEGQQFTLWNAAGMRVTISERGAALMSWWAPDRYGRFADVVLGCTDPAGYRNNRVPLGGPKDFHALRWRGETRHGEVLLRLAPPAGAAGFPVKLERQVRYRLDDDGALNIDYEAVTGEPAAFTLTRHPCFNLNGGSADVGDHMLQIEADHFLRTDATGTPLGVASVSGTPFDFRRPAAIGARLCWPDDQLRQASGFDHCYCIRGRAGELREVARVVDPGSGRCLQVSTSAAGLRFYSGHRLDDVRDGAVHPHACHDGFCLAAGAFLDQLDSEHAAASHLRPGQVCRQTTVYRIALQ